MQLLSKQEKFVIREISGKLLSWKLCQCSIKKKLSNKLIILESYKPLFNYFHPQKLSHL